VTTGAVDGRPYRISLAALPDAPQRSRAFLRDLMKLWNLPTDDDTAESALLLLSELATNAVQATGRDSGPCNPLPSETVPTIEVRAEASCTGLMVAVWDNSTTPPMVTDAADDQEGGRGMFLVTVLADEWGWCPETLAPATAPGKKVWFWLKRDFAVVVPEPATMRPAVPAQRPELPALPRRVRQTTPAPRPIAEPDPLIGWATGPDVLARVHAALRAARPALQTT
jgi:anti-sigma regulatory factor (Ser/Thr protein kinase)